MGVFNNKIGKKRHRAVAIVALDLKQLKSNLYCAEAASLMAEPCARLLQ